ncbi:MAG TPA: GLPGLI family protein [Candidatus Coprenecus merdipullorum]|nr:GLPGLI family protein [Candidatus Coprenecus merdipullorum]
MKKLLFLCFILAATCQADCLARAENTDSGIRVKYKYYFKNDSTIRGHYVDSSMCLDIFRDNAVFYSEKCYLMDSTLNASPLPVTLAVDPPAEFRGTMERSRYFIDYKDLSYIKYDRAIMTKIKGKGELPRPQWRMLDGTDTVCGYYCKTAEARYLGRTWKIWYAADIPVYAGPWLLWGAPGLILKARDSRGLFVFNAVEIGAAAYNRSGELRNLSDSQYNLRTYSSMHKAEEILTRVKRSYDEDMRFNGHQGGPIRATNEDGSVEIIELNMKYIPLIPENYWEKKGRKH